MQRKKFIGMKKLFVATIIYSLVCLSKSKKTENPCHAIRTGPLLPTSAAIAACPQSGRWIPNWWACLWCWIRCSRRTFAGCPSPLCPRLPRWRGGWPAPPGWGWSGRFWRPGGRGPSWWRWLPCGVPGGYEGLLRSLWVYCFLYRPVSHYFTGVMLL